MLALPDSRNSEGAPPLWTNGGAAATTVCPTWAEQDKSSVRAGPRNVARNQAADPSTLVDSSDTRATHRDQTVVESDLGRMTDKPEIGRISEELQAAHPAAHPKGVLYPQK